jgi:DnaA family protein
VVGRNLEVCDYLRRLPDVPERVIYLWGPSGAGKTHLLHACLADLPSRQVTQVLDRFAPLTDFAYQPNQRYAVDDITQLNAAQQDAVFALYQAIRAEDGQARTLLLVSGPCAPFQLNDPKYLPNPAAQAMREDLRSRLGAGLVWQIHALSDGEMAEALSQAAQARGLQLHPGIVPWLLTHWERSMPALMALLDALDRYSLERRRAAITLPLLKDLLAETR